LTISNQAEAWWDNRREFEDEDPSSLRYDATSEDDSSQPAL